jgi:nucleoside-diphosphate-sugar epimerase
MLTFVASIKDNMAAFHLVSGGAGFVGRNLIKRLLNTTNDIIVAVDDLSAGTHPTAWYQFDWPQIKKIKNLEIYGKEERLWFIHQDFRDFLRKISTDENLFLNEYGLKAERFHDIYHFAAIVGGRAKIDGDPMMVALDLSIDAEFFYWITRYKPARVLYPSSSAAYPVSLQGLHEAVALKETDIDFTSNLGKPDMTYGWSKMTGEYLAQIAARHYGLSVACVRPFSGYGEDQDLSYPVPAIAARAARKENPFEVWGSGRQGRDFVHIDDCIDAILLAINNISDGSAINIGSGKLTTFLELIELFTRFADYHPDIKPLLDKPVGVHSRYSDMSYVAAQFGWKPKISLEEGLRRVYDRAVATLS